VSKPEHGGGASTRIPVADGIRIGSDVVREGQLREPIVWYGPFVMNSKQEILETIDL
jgi:hypothetical protein